MNEPPPAPPRFPPCRTQAEYDEICFEREILYLRPIKNYVVGRIEQVCAGFLGSNSSHLVYDMKMSLTVLWRELVEMYSSSMPVSLLLTPAEEMFTVQLLHDHCQVNPHLELRKWLALP